VKGELASGLPDANDPKATSLAFLILIEVSTVILNFILRQILLSLSASARRAVRYSHKALARWKRRKIQDKLVDFLIVQVPSNKVHLGMFSSAAFERQKLLAQVDAMLAGEIRDFHVMADPIQPMAGSAHRRDGRRR